MTRPVSRKKIVWFRISGVVVSVVISLLIGELALRMLGFRPWADQPRGPEPLMFDYHPTYGWQSKEGTYTYSILPGGPSIHITVLPDGSRLTGPDLGADSDTKPKIVIVGCSFMFGWAISDPETLAWKLQEAFASHQVVNYGTGGYGTYQSLLRLEDVVPRMHPDIIVYGFFRPHESRNTAAGSWLSKLASSSQQGRVSMPYVTFSRGRLKRHGMIRYPCWPGRRLSALIALFEKSWANLLSSARTRHELEATQQLALDMKRLADQNHARFIFAYLGGYRIDPDHEPSYRSFAQAHHIEYVDCSQLARDESAQVPGDGHPNGKANAHWFESLEPTIRRLLTQKTESIP